MLESLLNIFNQSKDQVDEHSNDLIIGGLLVEAASIDGEIIDIEIASVFDPPYLLSIEDTLIFEEKLSFFLILFFRLGLLYKFAYKLKTLCVYL